MLKRIVFSIGLLTASVLAAQTVVIIGSSTAAGVGATNYDSSFAGRYGRYLTTLKPAWTLVNLAKGGFTTYECMPSGFKQPTNRPAPDTARNISKVLALHPQVLLICLPSNDVANNYAPAEYNANFDSLRAWATNAGIKTWITTPGARNMPDTTRQKRLVALKDRISSVYAPRYVSFFDSIANADGTYNPYYGAGDGIHANDRGHLLMFKRVVAANLTEIVTTYAISSGSFKITLLQAGTPGIVHGSLLFGRSGTSGAFDAQGRLRY